MPEAVYYITPYSHFDRQDCIDCFKSNIPRYFTIAETDEFEEWLSKFEGEESARSAMNDIYYYVIRNDHQIVGCGGFGLQPGGREVVFAWGLIHNDFQKKGFGKALFLFRLETIRRLYPGLDIVLDTTQHTFAFFGKLGFVTEKITSDFYAHGLDRYDMRMKGGKGLL